MKLKQSATEMLMPLLFDTKIIERGKKNIMKRVKTLAEEGKKYEDVEAYANKAFSRLIDKALIK